MNWAPGKVHDFQRFDPANGELLQIKFTATLNGSMNGAAENREPGKSAEAAFEDRLRMQVTMLDANLLNLYVFLRVPDANGTYVSLAPFTLPLWSGPDTMSGGDWGSIQGSVVYTSAVAMAPYIGTGNFTLPASGYAVASGIFLGGNTVFDIRSYGWSNATITYTYDDSRCLSGYKLDRCTSLPLSGWTIRVSNATRTWTATTDANGFWRICHLDNGTYAVCEVPQSGWTQTDPIGCYAKTIDGPNITNINFTNQKMYCISGYKYNNCTGQPISGWEVNIYNATTNLLVGTATTDGTGYWQVCGLIPGNYEVEENLLPGWQNLTNLTNDVTLGCINLSNVSFINKPAQCTQSQTEDLSISKVAQVNGVAVQQVSPGQIFSYNITVANKDTANDASLVVVTDKLPYEVEYLGTEVYPSLPADYAVNQSGDLIYVRLDQVAAGSSRYINITVKAPIQAPTTLYNIVNLRQRDDKNLTDNRMTLVTYIPQVGYNQTEAAKSFEDLLHNQSQLLFQFEDLLHTIPSNNSTNYSFLASFEQLLRSQADLTSSFEDLLTNASSIGWDVEYTEENRTALLWSYEQMLYDEAFLFASFNMKINDSWISLCRYTKDGHSQDAQTELIASFEDLLKRQTRLYKSFNLLLNEIDITSQPDRIDFLAAYENLLRIEANLLMSFNELLDMKYESRICP